MQIQTITADYLKTICWKDNAIVDWAGGKTYLLNGEQKQFGYHYAFNFDSAVSSADGIYVFIYEKLGTKGLLLKNGELLREINRSYYCANSYEYPAAFTSLNNKTYLIHCPIAYNQLDFEDVETGEIITNIVGRQPDDMFHSRLEVSADGVYLMSKGWVWHPLSRVVVFNINECLENPLLLDSPQLYPNAGVEICTASFINENKVLIGSSDEVIDDDEIRILPPKHICIWDLTTNQLSKPTKVNGEFGNVFAIDSNYAWDMFEYPKIIDINRGEVMDLHKNIDSGKQRSSLINAAGNYPSIIFNRQTKQVAIKTDEKIQVLTPDFN